MRTINVLLFDGFTTLDALGPTEVLGRLTEHLAIRYVSAAGGLIEGSSSLRIDTAPVSSPAASDILLVPGGLATRALVQETAFIALLRRLAAGSAQVLCVCTGSALLAKTGLLQGIRATSNKLAWDWVVQQGPGVLWERRARWVADGRFYSSSGVSAGIDMALGFVADAYGIEAARKISRSMEYVWNEDSTQDPFA